jgi:hypothetical protein
VNNKKICPKCGRQYPVSLKYFFASKNNQDGLFSWCKKCKGKSNKKSYLKHKIEINLKRKLFRQKHRKQKSIKDKIYREKLKNRKLSEIQFPRKNQCKKCKQIKTKNDFYKNFSKINGLDSFCKICRKDSNFKQYRKQREKRIEIFKQYARKNKEKLKNRKKAYGQKHKKERNKYLRDRKKNDLNFKILSNLRTRLWRALKAQKAKKYLKTIFLIGCSADELKKHLKAKFLNGMSFDNYGAGSKKWSIDHIIPCSYFNLSDPKQQQQCFHYSNLAPLWNKDNFSKNSLYNGKYIRKTKNNIKETL